MIEHQALAFKFCKRDMKKVNLTLDKMLREVVVKKA